MKTKILSIISLLFCLLLLNVTTAFAAKSYTCSIETVGGSGPAGITYILLTDTAASPKFTSRWFTISQANANYFLAVILTAISQEKDVVVTLDSVNRFTVIQAVYVNF